MADELESPVNRGNMPFVAPCRHVPAYAPWFSFGRLRPLHTNAVIFAFGGSSLFATSYYVVQRTSHARLFAPGLATFTFWGWQAVIVLAVITLPLSLTQGKEYAELIWPIDILIAVIWEPMGSYFLARS